MTVYVIGDDVTPIHLTINLDNRVEISFSGREIRLSAEEARQLYALLGAHFDWEPITVICPTAADEGEG